MQKRKKEEYSNEILSIEVWQDETAKNDSSKRYTFEIEQNRLLKSFGAAVLYYRKLRELTQQQLADHAGITKNYLGEIERGIKSPSYTTMFCIAKALNIEIEKLTSLATRELRK